MESSEPGADSVKTTSRLVLFFLFTLALWRFLRPRGTPTLRTVAILVLGDIGRSPRMMYHAESFAKLGFDTYLVGYRGIVLHGL